MGVGVRRTITEPGELVNAGEDHAVFQSGVQAGQKASKYSHREEAQKGQPLEKHHINMGILSSAS